MYKKLLLSFPNQMYSLIGIWLTPGKLYFNYP